LEDRKNFDLEDVGERVGERKLPHVDKCPMKGQVDKLFDRFENNWELLFLLCFEEVAEQE
jgi:hypothetical protein